MNLRRKVPAKRQRVTEVEESSNGFSVKLGDAKEDDAATDFNSVHKFEMAATRSGVALELADLMDFTKFNVWLERLLDAMNRQPSVPQNLEYTGVRRCARQALHCH